MKFFIKHSKPEFVGIYATEIWRALGSFHCLSQQKPLILKSRFYHIEKKQIGCLAAYFFI
jgi:hypothetical protein